MTPSDALNNTLGISEACKLLNQQFPGDVLFPTHVGYEEAQHQSWSPTCWLPAALFVRPKTTEDVAKTLSIISRTGTKFALRAGGQNPNSGIASVGESGILIDLCKLKNLSMGEDGVLHVGAGVRWGEVYTYLEKLDRTAIGAKHHDVGVGGFILGAGLPAFVDLHGFGCDNLRGAEVVLSDGTVVEANEKENSDLLWALKGAATNFGVVTRFDIQTYPNIKCNFTVNIYNPADYANVLKATAAVQRIAEHDHKIGIFVNVHPSFIAAGLFYADWTDGPPKCFEPFWRLDSLLQSAMPNTNGYNKGLVDSIALTAPAFRRTVTTVTTKVSEALYLDAHQLCAKLRADHPRLTNVVYTVQAIGPFAAERGEQQGGNPLGIEKCSQSFWALVIEWNEAVDDAEAERVAGEFREGLEQMATEQGQILDFLFMSDCNKDQRVLASYGADNLKKLSDIAAKYDKKSIFQNLQNDGFLLRKSLA